MQRASKSILFGFLLFSASLCHAQNNSPNLEQGTASISGRVTIDGKPARGIRVKAISNDSNLQFQQLTGKVPIPYAKTDENGVFHLNNLAPGEYRLRPIAPAMVGILDEGIKKQTIVLKTGSTVAEIHIKLTRGSVITGRVTYEDGSPVINASVICSPAESRQQPISTFSYPPVFIERADFTTDDRGIYRVFGLPEGMYKVGIVMDKSHLKKSRQYPQAVYYPHTIDKAKAISVEVKNGSETRDIDIQLGAPQKLYIATGRVVDAETGEPIANVSIQYFSSKMEVGYLSEEVKADIKGEFKLTDIPSGSYICSASEDQKSGRDYYSDVTSFDVQNNNVSGIEIKIHKGLSISGTIVFQNEDSSSSIAKLQQLKLSADSRQKDGGLTRAEAEISPDNTFIFKGLSPGEISIYPTERKDFAILGIERNGEDASDLEIHTGETINNLRITVAETDCAIRGQIIIASGTLPDNTMLRVSARRINSDPPNPDDYRLSKGNISVNPDNRFTIQELVAGKYEVTLIAEVRTKDKLTAGLLNKE